MVVGKQHEIGSCDADKKTRHLITCKRCGTQSLMWHHCNVNGDANALYVATKTGYKQWDADTMNPHRCTGRMQTIPEPLAPVTDESKLRELAEEVAGSVARKALEGAHKELGSKFDEFVLTVTSGLNDALMSRLEELALPAKTLTIELLGDDGEIRRVEGAHAQMPELLYWANSKDMHGYRWPVMLFGKPGVSKSFSTKQAADAMGLSFGLISLNPQTPESRLFGFIDAGGKYHRTLFREAFENGGVFLIDEIDNANDALLTSLNSCLANGHGAFPDGRIERHADFVCVATANTPGRGGDANHSGRRQLDAATINRFAVIEWKNDDELEMRIATAINEKAGRLWLEWIRKVRVYCEAHHPRVIVSPRSTYMGAKALLDSPFTIEQIADMTLFKGLDKDTKAKILSACPFPAVSK